MDPEQWRDVVGWEGVYQVSNLGGLRRVSGGQGVRKGRVLTGGRQPSGYVKVVFQANGRKERDWLHRVVARAFIGPIPPRIEVNHRDLVPAHNHVGNLELLTHKQNIQHAAENGAMRRGDDHPLAVLTTALVVTIKQKYRQGQKGAAIARDLNVNKDTVYSVLQGKSWRHVTIQELAE